MGTSHQEIIQEVVEELLQKLGFEASVEVFPQEGPMGAFLCKVRVQQDQNFLIGQYGANLAAVSHLVRVMLRKKTEERINVIVDVNDYFSEKKALLEKEAEKAVEEVLKNNLSVALRPMLPYERKIVHSFLSENPRIATESIGVGDARKIMVSLKQADTPAEEVIENE